MAEQRLGLPLGLDEFREMRVAVVVALHVGDVHRVDHASLQGQPVNLGTANDERLLLTGLPRHFQRGIEGSQARRTLGRIGSIPRQHDVGAAW